MRRPWLVWLWFGFSAAAIFAAMGWACLQLVRLDREGREARRTAALEENVRLSLWRMETVLAPLIIQESARPYFAYQAFYPAGRSYTRMFGRSGGREVLVASPLLDQPVPLIRLHFQLDGDGTLGSPQVPAGALAKYAAGRKDLEGRIREAAARLAEFRQQVQLGDLTASTPSDWLLVEKAAPASPAGGTANQPPGSDVPAAQPAQAAVPARKDEPPARELPPEAKLQVEQNEPAYQQTQQVRNVQEWAARDNTFQLNLEPRKKMEPPQQQEFTPVLKKPPSPVESGGVWVGVLRPVWSGGELLLCRQVKAGGAAYLQGCWLDWPVIRQRLRESIRDLLPEADVRPVNGRPDPSSGRTLASLPLELIPGRPPAGSVLPEPSSLPLSLLLAGLSILAALGATGILLLGAVTLGQRRAAFVSAVTHELRTPLTTFRMYTEMLSEGMAGGPDQQQEYHRTLQREADRLSHLVENVLAYARLERGRYGVRERVAAAGLLSRTVPRLAEHAARAGMELVVEEESGVAQLAVMADQAAVERILFNLVDNATRYARGTADGRIHLRLAREGRHLVFTVADHGPGIDPAGRKKLFRPFCKSAREAARSAPGVGLGLVLSRRLARSLGGRLRLEETSPAGTRFRLELPLAREGGTP